MTWKTFFSPSLKIAGGRALFIGIAGLAVCIAAATLSGWHPNGLLQFGPGPHGDFGIAVLEYLIIWLVPAAIFYGLGAALSTSRIRVVDVLGTTAFALLPLVPMNLLQLIPAIRNSLGVFMELSTFSADMAGDPELFAGQAMETMLQPLFILNTFISLVVVVLLVIWLFNAVRISCNLKGGRLWAVYLIGLTGGDIVCRMLIGLLR